MRGIWETDRRQYDEDIDDDDNYDKANLLDHTNIMRRIYAPPQYSLWICEIRCPINYMYSSSATNYKINNLNIDTLPIYSLKTTYFCIIDVSNQLIWQIDKGHSNII